MHPVMLNGKPSGHTTGFKREQDGTIVRHGARADGSTVEVHISLSPDGNTMTIEGNSKSKDGKESREKQVWHRVSGSHGKPAS